MSRPRIPQPAKLVISLFMRERELIAPLARAFTAKFGAIDIVSRWLAFDFTAYYEREMGAPLYRRVLVFQDHVSPGHLARIKLMTNRLERHHIVGGRRTVNLDPGYLTLERFVLATGKNFTHRIYLSRGIYADLTLIYTRGELRPLPWTYPDYAAPDMIRFLGQVRRKYVADLKREARATQQLDRGPVNDFEYDGVCQQ